MKKVLLSILVIIVVASCLSIGYKVYTNSTREQSSDMKISVSSTSMQNSNSQQSNIGSGDNYENSVKVNDLKIDKAKVEEELQELSTPTPTPTPTQYTNYSNYQSYSSSTTYGEYIDINSGDEDNTESVSKSEKIFISDVTELTRLYPLNKIDFILTDISKPIISKYGYDNYIYKLSKLKGKASDVIKFQLKSKNGDIIKVTITNKDKNYEVKVIIK